MLTYLFDNEKKYYTNNKKCFEDSTHRRIKHTAKHL